MPPMHSPCLASKVLKTLLMCGYSESYWMSSRRSQEKDAKKENKSVSVCVLSEAAIIVLWNSSFLRLTNERPWYQEEDISYQTIESDDIVLLEFLLKKKNRVSASMTKGKDKTGHFKTAPRLLLRVSQCVQLSIDKKYLSNKEKVESDAVMDQVVVGIERLVVS